MEVRRFWNTVRLFVAIAAVVAMFFVMTQFSAFVYWMGINSSRAFFFGFAAIWLSALMAWGIWMEKREQKRFGVKRPIFRWHNNP